MSFTTHHLLPQPAHIVSIEVESGDTRTFVVKLDAAVPDFDQAVAGQFLMLSLLGHGEAAFTLSSLPAYGAEKGTVVFTVRRIGQLTSALFELKVGSRLGVRGPFGHGFTAIDHTRPALYVGGGCGLSPLKAAIETHIARRPAATPIVILYGARTPSTRIHRSALARWAQLPGVSVIECVDVAEADWTGRVGIVDDLIDDALGACAAAQAALCGPPAMLQVVAQHLRGDGLAAANIHLAMERYMKCGTGRCGHCYINHRYVCTDGPVFSFADLLTLPEAFGAAAVHVAA